MFTNLILSIIFFLSQIISGNSFYYSAPILEFKNLPEDFSLSADKVAVFSEEERIFLHTKNIDEAQPIASITKLMTAMVFLDEKPDLNKTYKIERKDIVEGGKINLFLGDELSLKNLFYTSLIASDNGATIALAHALDLSEEEFVEKMNQKAKDLVLLQTKFKDPIGLSEENISSAREVVLLFKEALKYEEIRDALKISEYRYETIGGREKIIESTDSFLLTDNNEDMKSLGGKTGYINEAGYCFVGEFENNRGEKIIVSVLNSDNRNSRFIESRDLADLFSR